MGLRDRHQGANQHITSCLAKQLWWDAVFPSPPGCRKGWGTWVSISIVQQEGDATRMCSTAYGLGKLRHAPVWPAFVLELPLSHLLKASPAPTPTAGRAATGMQREGNKRERYQAPADPPAQPRAEAGRRTGGRERRRKEKKIHP